MQQLKIGSSLQGGKYKIEKVLGQGGFGITYLAIQELLGRKVCIKEFFFKEYCERDEATSHVSLGTQSNHELVERFMTKFLKEARTISQLEHPHIIRIHDIFKENNTAYYVMEYIEGESLADRVNHYGCLPESEAVEYIKQVASALEFIHQQSINHLDVKPANIMIRKSDNKAVLIDFGLSKQYDEQGGQTSTTPVGISHGYAPMEQYNVGGVSTFSPQTDIYSLGATLYKLVTGNTPPQAGEVLNEGLPSLPNSVSSLVIEVIKKAMQPRKVDRQNSIDEFVNGLNILFQDYSFAHSEINVHENIECDEETKVIVDSNFERVEKKEGLTDNLQSNASTNLANEEKNGNKKALIIFIILGCIVLCFAWFKKFDGGDTGAYINNQIPEIENIRQTSISESDYDKAMKYYENQDYGNAVSLFASSANKGIAAAQYMLGICYYNGYGVYKSLSSAKEWLEKAIEGGNEEAEKLLKQIKNEEKIAKTTSTKDNEIVSGKKKFYDGTYVGKLLNGKPHGQGTYYYSNGNVYIGNWLNGKKNGWGEFKWSDGSKYIGHWSNDKFHGSGTLYNVDGSIRDTGDWENGTLKKVKTKRTQSSINDYNMSNNMLIIKGKVTDGKKPILLVNVVEKGTSNKTTTDYYGDFTLKVRKGAIIQFSDVLHQTIELKADSNMEVKMRRK